MEKETQESSANPRPPASTDVRIIDIKKREKQLEEEKSELIASLEHDIFTGIRGLRKIAGQTHAAKTVEDAMNLPF